MLQPFPQATVRFERRVVIDKIDRPEHSLVFEGELPMSQQEADQIKALLGDGKASVSISKGIGDLNYGSGGNVRVTVTLTCDQSVAGVEGAKAWASHLTANILNEEHPR